MPLIDIREYRTAAGERPYFSWLIELDDSRDRGRILARLDRMALGNCGDTRSLGQGLFELRFHFGPGYRIYFGRLGRSVVLLLGGGDKGSQNRDIEKARSRWMNYRSES